MIINFSNTYGNLISLLLRYVILYFSMSLMRIWYSGKNIFAFLSCIVFHKSVLIFLNVTANLCKSIALIYTACTQLCKCNGVFVKLIKIVMAEVESVIR
jgi:hypothetical protein